MLCRPLLAQYYQVDDSLEYYLTVTKQTYSIGDLIWEGYGVGAVPRFLSLQIRQGKLYRIDTNQRVATSITSPIISIVTCDTRCAFLTSEGIVYRDEVFPIPLNGYSDKSDPVVEIYPLGRLLVTRLQSGQTQKYDLNPPITIDYASLYPSIIRAYRLDYSQIVPIRPILPRNHDIDILPINGAPLNLFTKCATSSAAAKEKHRLKREMFAHSQAQPVKLTAKE